MKKQVYITSMLLTFIVGLGVWANVNDGRIFRKPLKPQIMPLSKQQAISMKSKTARKAEAGNSKTAWSFKLSQQTINGIEEGTKWNDYWQKNACGWSDDSKSCYTACFSFNGGQFGPLQYVADGEGHILPETEGLYFGSIYGDENHLGVDLFTDGRDYMRLNYSFTWVALVNVAVGQSVTVCYKAQTKDKSENQSISFNAYGLEYKSGDASNDTTEFKSVVFNVTENGGVFFCPSNGLDMSNVVMLVKSIKLTASRTYAEEVRSEVQTYINDSIAEYPGIKAELTEAYEASAYTDDTPDDELSMKVENLKTIFGKVRAVVRDMPNFHARIAQAEKYLATPAEGAPVEELSAALAAAKALDAATARSNDYATASAALENAIYEYMSFVLPIKDWNFNRQLSNELYNISVDDYHRIARWDGFNGVYMVDTYEVPEYVVVDGVRYNVVSMRNRNSYNQDVISSLVLPKNLRRIEDNTFAGFRNLRSLDIPKSVEQIDGNIFGYYWGSGTDNLRDIYLHNEKPLESTEAYSSRRVHVPDGCFHTYRLSPTWNQCVIIPETPVEVAVEVADEGELGRLVLDKAGYLQEVNRLKVSGRLGNDDWSTLSQMTNLVYVDLSGVPNNAIPSYQFYNTWAMDSVCLPSKTEIIGNNAFENSGISEMKFPETLSTIGDKAFYSCKFMDNVVFPASMRSVGKNAFNDNKNLKHLVLNEGLTTLGNRAFYGCDIRSLQLPSTLGMLKSEVFRENVRLETVQFAEGLTVIESNAFYNCKSIKELVMPSTLLEIKYNAFAQCDSLKSLTLNEGLKSIGENAFINCWKLEEVTLPSSLRMCTGVPFAGCQSLTTMNVHAVIPPTTNGSTPIANVDMTKVKLFVPTWSLNEYMLAPGWNSFLTVEASDYMPQNVVINKDFVFSLRDELAEDYRPNIYMLWSDVKQANNQGTEEYLRGNLTINSRSKLPVNDFVTFMSPYAKYYSDQRLASTYYGSSIIPQNPTSLIVNGEMRAENVTINLVNKKNVWQFISFPFDVKMSDIVPVDENTQWVVREYSGYNRANGKNESTWLNLTADSELKAGRGYIMQCYNGSDGNQMFETDDNGVKYGSECVLFTVSPVKESVNRQAIFIATDRSVKLEEHLSEFEHNRSWNLIGNPYPSFYDTRFLNFEGIITVWNSYSKAYKAYSPVDDSYILSPGEAFFVQRPVDQEDITFAKEGRQTYSYARILDNNEAKMRNAETDAKRYVYNLTLSGNGLTDGTRVVFNEKAKAEYELNRDASKFMSIEPAMPQFYTVNGNVNYAINERPAGSGIVELGMHIGAEGEYTIAVEGTPMGEVVLEDRLTGEFIVLTETEGYTFHAVAGDSAGRFFLHINAMGDTNGITDIIGGSTNADAPAYSISGQRVNAATYKGIMIVDGKKIVNKK